MHKASPSKKMRFLRGCWALAFGMILISQARAAENESQATAKYRDEVEPILVDYCYGCHGDGAKKGNVDFDRFTTDAERLQDRTLWGGVLKNVRAGIMPPAGKPRPSAEEVRSLEGWIKRGVLGLDPNDPDPGRVTIRRLNRGEYRNTIRDLMGIDYHSDEEFPPDDTGYGFDNIGDVLSVSPLLLEKYMQAAESVVKQAVPTVGSVTPSIRYSGREFRGSGGINGARMSFYKEATVSHPFYADKTGTYHVIVELAVKGGFEFDPGRCKVVLKAGDQELMTKEFQWQDGKTQRFEFTEKWKAGGHPLSFHLEPLSKPEEMHSSVDLLVASVVVEGPLEPEHRTRPKNYDRFFFGDDPTTPSERRRYIRDVLARFATKAYRRPIEERNLDRLVSLAERTCDQPGKTVQQGVADAMVAILSSPRFLFRVEEVEPDDRVKAHARVDEYALASRLSYFLWSTMPDDELFALARRGELRKNLASQIKRMMADEKSEMFVKNFVGQWLQARDVEGISIDAREVLARDDGEEKELKREQEEFRAALAQREAERKKPGQDQPKGPVLQRRQQFRGQFKRIFGTPRASLDGPLRQAMRRETEMVFEEVVKEDRSILELLDSDRTFLNERLAKHYGIPGVTGEEMRSVKLPEGSPRGGLLTQGTVLIVTSNPTRTSPVKRGLFILDNFLGTPPPPPPAVVPQLEDSEKEFQDREPSLREVLEIHRVKPLCSSCHSRMDPLGLAMENFNALGMWRETERKQPLDTGGKLITGETFSGVRELKRLLKTDRRGDFYRCLTEKLLTYALGRGLESSDVESVDQIVDRLEANEGRFSALLTGVIESAPFQKRRNVSAAATTADSRQQTRDKTAIQP